MITEALKFFTELVQKSSVVKVLEEQPDHKSLLVAHGGTLHRFDKKPEPRRHTVDTMDDFVEAAERWGASSEKGGVVWITPPSKGDDGATLTLVADDSDRIDTVTCFIPFSQTWLTLRQLPKSFTQREFIALLRNRLLNAVADTLLPKVRRIEALSSGRASSEVSQGRERGVKEFQAELSNATDIPEYLPIQSYVFAHPFRSAAPAIVKCSMDVTLPPAEVVFRLDPLPEEIQSAELGAVAELAGILRGALNLLVLIGTP